MYIYYYNIIYMEINKYNNNWYIKIIYIKKTRTLILSIFIHTYSKILRNIMLQYLN